MDISTQHADAVTEACRIPALDARLLLLAQPDPQQVERSVIDLYGTAYPSPPGDPPGGSPLATIEMTDTAGLVDQGLYQLLFDVPVEGQVTGADPTGTVPLWARITTYDGVWWGDVTVSETGGGGEIELEETSPGEVKLLNGAITRITSAIIQG